jgi:SAM-dependent methyltransferase
MGDVATHYGTGGPIGKVNAALERIAPDGGPLEVEQLMGFDHFHTAGPLATARMADRLSPGADDTVLDIGCGVGGPARYLADRFGCQVIGVDLTPEFIEIADMLSERTGLADRVDARVGDATALELDEASVDHAWTQHVAMNIADREALYAETRRVLKPGGRFVLFDVIDGGGGDLLLPVPWATEPEHSHLVAADDLRDLLGGAGFTVETWEDPTEEFVELMRTTMFAPPPEDGPPPLTPGVLIDDLATKGANYLQNMGDGRTALAMVVCTAS